MTQNIGNDDENSALRINYELSKTNFQVGLKKP